MFNANRPARSDLPSTAQLLKSTGIAAVVASVLVVTVVMPAEYGVDPTRVGSLLGLTEMGRIKVQLAAEAEADAAADATAGTGVTAAPAIAAAQAPAAPAATAQAQAQAAPGARTDETVLTLAPDQGAEIKLVMEEGAKARFTWTSSGGRINYDTHADRPGVSYHGYEKGSAQEQTGELTAAFTGSHGWFWRNRTGAPVTITLRTQGAYSEVKRVV
ncbi:MAG: transmembrane anchor protein [Alphaproteobacteria bacterium]|nr:MAG: transmembrane anchor protein [Alphaproteobacteria bacterium]